MSIVVRAECGRAGSAFDVRCVGCGAPLDHGGSSGPVGGPEPPAAQTTEPGPGRKLGPYRLLEELGRGGMGVVHRAVHEGSARTVALKTVRLPHAGLMEGLRREIRALSRLRHPGIVRILEQGVEDGLPWYAMELIEGRTLRAWTGSLASEQPTASAPVPSDWWTHSLPPGASGKARGRGQDAPEAPGAASAFHATAIAGADSGVGEAAADGAMGTAVGADSPVVRGGREWISAVLTVVRRLCAPLAYMHGEGLVHRDLKPDNILIRAASSVREAVSERHKRNADDRSLIAHGSSLVATCWPMLADFGLVSRFGGAGREALDPESLGVGTAHYVAPEQARGESLDARADVYALGCVLYELLAGRPPFTDSTAAGVLLQHLHVAPIPPSRAAPEVGLHPAAARLDALTLALLEKDPGRRLGYADAVAAVLAEIEGASALADSGEGSRHIPAEEPEAPRPRPYLYRPALAGRENALVALERQLTQLDASAPALLLVVGESGVGKTRLLSELARRAEHRGLRVVAGECLEHWRRAVQAGVYSRKALQIVGSLRSEEVHAGPASLVAGPALQSLLEAPAVERLELGRLDVPAVESIVTTTCARSLTPACAAPA